jgi:hypothetical protein
MQRSVNDILLSGKVMIKIAYVVGGLPFGGVKIGFLMLY